MSMTSSRYMDGDNEEAPPPAKIAAVDYRYCSHCERTVSKRTYRKHMSLPDEIPGPSTSAPSLPKSIDVQTFGNDEVTDERSREIDNDENETLLETETDHHDEGMNTEDNSSNYNSSSSEFEECESDNDFETSPADQSASDKRAYSLVRWFVVFVCIWQTMHTVSDAALGLLLGFVSAFFRLVASLTSAPLLIAVADAIPASLHLLKRYIKPDREPYVKYVVCPTCYTLYKFEDCFEQNEMGEKIPKKCTNVKFPNHPQRNRRLPCSSPLLTKVHMSGGKVKFVPRYTYVYQPLRASLQRLLMRCGIAEQLEHWRTRECEDGLMSDVYDGQIWKDFNSEKYFRFLQNKRCYGLMLNFDFFQPYKHTPASYGVFYMTLMNLPREQRFKRENVLLIGVIPAFDHEPSDLNPFMEPMVDELKQFWSPGIRLFSAESTKFKLLFRLALMCVACDIPAARKVCGFMGHGANLGCSRCLKHFPCGFDKKTDCSGFDRGSWSCRDLAVHRATCLKLKQCKSLHEATVVESQTGIRYSILTELPYFDPIRFTVVDPMHNLFLGTAKRVMKNIWMGNDMISKENMKVIQCRVDSIKAPSDIGRIPRKIASSFSGFTAEQWKNWVVIYSLFALRGILPQEHYTCWQAFVLSCFFLCRREISHINMKKADLLLLKFCKSIQNLYGNVAVTPNMHLHGHIVECVKDYGPIYGFWLFSFERYNGILGSYPTNKRNTSEQLMQRFIRDIDCFCLELPDMYNDYFCKLVPHSTNASILHQHQALQSSNNCYDLQFVCLPTISKVTSLSLDDSEKLKAVYSSLYNDPADCQLVCTIRVFKTISFFGHHLGSLKAPSTKNSSYIMASWAENNGTIGTATILRPGKVLYYCTHSYKINGHYREHLFAVVYWYAEQPEQYRSLYGKPLEVWKDSHIPEGPAMFLPIHRLMCRCAVSHSMFPSPEGEERAVFISPLPSLKFH